MPYDDVGLHCRKEIAIPESSRSDKIEKTLKRVFRAERDTQERILS